MSYYPPITIAAAIQKIDYKQYLLPAIQREFVWSHTNIELLFDSLMREYPIGSLLMWQVNGENKTSHRYYEVLKKFRQRYLTHCEEINTANLPDFEAVLDGQQRLTALYIGLKGSYAFKMYRLGWNDNEYSLPTRKLYLKLNGLLNQDDPDGETEEDGRIYDFRFLTKEEARSDNENIWFEVGQILDLQGVFKLNKFIKDNGWENDEFVNETLSRLHDTVHVKPLINYYLETSKDYEKALNIFIRVNSGGTKLDYSDLIMSTTIAGWQKLKAREEFNSLIDEIWNNHGFEINKDLVLRTYLMLFSDDIKFRVTNFTVNNAREFENNWVEIRHAITEAFLLVKDFGYVEHTMTSKNAVLPIIYYLYRSGRTKEFTKKVQYHDDRMIIRRWLHAVLLHRIFGGQADSVLKIIRDSLAKELQNGAEIFPAVKIAERLSKTRKSITVDEEFIENLLYTTYDDRYAFPILALLYPHLDYRNNDFHKDHVHPISAFNAKSIKALQLDKEDKRNEYFEGYTLYNGIVNLQLLDGNQNKSKSKKTFTEWVATAVPPVDLNKQLLPDITDFERFPDFVDTRWEILKTKLTEVLTFKENA